MDADIELEQGAAGAGGGTPISETVEAGGGAGASSQPAGGDSRLSGILAKKERGETLTAAERGYLGAVRRREGRKGAANQPGNSLFVAGGNPENPLFAVQDDPQASPGMPPVAPVDPDLIRRTADALLSSVDTVTKIYVGYEVKAAGGDKETVKQYQDAVALEDKNRALMVENSEPVISRLCELLGCTPDKLQSTLQGSGFVMGLAAHSLAVWTALKQIRENAKPAGSKEKATIP